MKNYNQKLDRSTVRLLANRKQNTVIVLINLSNSNTMGVYESYEQAVTAYETAPFPAHLAVANKG